MAKKRGGGGSNIGLIITLVFFILTTVILGVTTYMGYSEIDKAKEGEKKSGIEAKNREKEANWYRANYRIAREYLGQPIQGKDEDRATWAKDRESIGKGDLAKYGNETPGKDDVAAFLTKMDATMPWKAPGEISPPITYETRLAEKDRQIAAITKTADKFKVDAEEAADRERKLIADLAEQKKLFDSQIAANRQAADKALTAERASYVKALADSNNENKAKEVANKFRSDAEKERDSLATQLKTEKGKVAQLNKDIRAVQDEKDKWKSERDTLLAKVGGDSAALEAEQLDAKALEILRSWPKDKMNWQIIRLDQKGTLPYINLGSANGLQAQVTFSVHSMGRDGKLSPTPKGTVEVVQVIDRGMARVRVTSIKDAKNDPIVAGDRLFNATWDPSQKKRVAIAGLADLGGDGLDSSEDLRRLLKRQGITVDAYIDTKNDKQPEIKNDQGEKGDITTKTDYVILAESLDSAKHPKKGGDYGKAFDRQMTEMKEKAKTNGVTIISLRRYLELIGYKPPKVISTGNSDYGR